MRESWGHGRFRRPHNYGASCSAAGLRVSRARRHAGDDRGAGTAGSVGRPFAMEPAPHHSAVTFGRADEHEEPRQSPITPLAWLGVLRGVRMDRRSRARDSETMPTEPNTTCFFIAPIGDDGTEIRQRSDGVRDFIVKPAAAELGFSAIRADEISSPGQITTQVINQILNAKCAVADLTGNNANVFYELALRHTARLPVVLIAEEGSRLPFDISQMRTIWFCHTDLRSAASCKDQIVEQLKMALEGAVDSPVTTAIDLNNLDRGSTLERVVSEVAASLEKLSLENAKSTADIRSMIRDIDGKGPCCN